ncbi:hypothetical protein ACQWFZ_25960, partial [Salmonella enterica subsp. enterica serovar Infantis]
GSDSPESAPRASAFFFGEGDVCPRTRYSPSSFTLQMRWR